MIPTSALLWAALAAVAVTLGVLQLLPSRPTLGATRTPPAQGARGGDRNAWAEHVGAQLLRRYGGVLWASRQDLAVLGRSPASHVGRGISYVVGCLVLPQLGVALLALAGAAPPVGPPAVFSVGLAVFSVVALELDLRRDAAKARREFRYAVASFLDRAALTRAADAGAADALYRTAAVGDGWALERVRAALEQSRLSGVSPWETLAELAREIGVPELTRPAETFALAGEAGAPVESMLAGQERALRTALLTDAKARANAASEKLVLPLAGLALVFLLFIGYPAFARILAA